MKVICIDNKPKGGGSWPLVQSLVEGKKYTVAEEHGGGYILEETYDQQFSERQAFMKSRFIAVSAIDESKFERNYNKQTA